MERFISMSITGLLAFYVLVYIADCDIKKILRICFVLFVWSLFLIFGFQSAYPSEVRQGSYVCWYGPASMDQIHGRKYGDYTYRGERIDWQANTCASYSFKQGTKLRIWYKKRYVDVTVTDKGGHRRPEQHFKPIILELTPAAFKVLSPLKSGKLKVKIIKLDRKG